MFTSNDIKPEDVDLTILDRIGEADVRMWMIARLLSARNGTLPALNTLGVTAAVSTWHRNDFFYLRFNVHGAGKCSGCEESIDSAFAALRREILNDPAKQASDKRMEAQRLLREADELSAAAKRIEGGAS